ncbi:hypothetical protein AB6D20_027855 (plasmid) [Vibrio splendidus]
MQFGKAVVQFGKAVVQNAAPFAVDNAAPFAVDLALQVLALQVWAPQIGRHKSNKFANKFVTICDNLQNIADKTLPISFSISRLSFSISRSTLVKQLL